MRKEALRYWNYYAARSDQDAREVIFAGIRAEKQFDRAGRLDAERLLLPFVSRKSVILDVGCGLGRLLKWVAPYCKEAIGLDVSSEMLRKARRRLAGLQNVRFMRLPLSLTFPLESRSVDFAWFYHVSEHVEREDSFRILTEIRRCLRREGKALVQFSLITHPANMREFRKWARLGDEEGVRSRFYTEEEVHSLLEMVKLFPQHRMYVPGEFVVVATKSNPTLFGAMPKIRLYTEPASPGARHVKKTR